MTPTADNKPDSPDSPIAIEEGTGLPGLKTWTALYVFVAIVFITWVVLLYALTRTYS